MSQYNVLTAEQAAELIQNGDNIGFSGFTPAGSPKAVSRALAEKAKRIHAEGQPFKVGVLTGASTGASLDGALAEADAIDFRTPYQSNASLRKAINAGKVKYFDMHLSLLPQYVRYGFLGKINWAVIEACDVTEDGEIVLSTAVGAAPTYASVADKIIIELNAYHPKELRGIHDIYQPQDPPHRRELPVYTPNDRIGATTIKVDPKKIVAIVHTNEADEIGGFKDSDPVTDKIGENVAAFLASEIKAGRIPQDFLPVQSGVGNIANAVLGAMGRNDEIPKFKMYSEVIQDSVIELMKSGKLVFASGVSLTVSKELLKEMYANLDFYKERIVLRPQEVSNSPELVRRMGLICINTAIEVDIFGNVNSTHVLGQKMMNGIGGSGDFARNAYLSIFTCPSVAKGGAISSIVPLASHMDHSEHSVNVIITEQGVADLRGKSPRERALTIIENCAHPEYREALLKYFNITEAGQTPQSISEAFNMHMAFLNSGDMRNAEF